MLGSRFVRGVFIAGVVMALSPAGCGYTIESVEPTLETGVESIESTQSKAWIGRHSSELSTVLGEPDSKIDVNVSGEMPAEAWIYSGQRVAGTGACVNAFVVHTLTGEVLNYFCR